MSEPASRKRRTLRKKIKFQKENITMATDSICLHHKFGFCKHGERCRNQHIQEICENKECRVSECRKRHPRSCRYFKMYQRCKFGDYCAFNHEVTIDPILEELRLVKQNVEALEKQVKDKNEEIKDILVNLEKTLKTLNLQTANKNRMPNNTKLSTITTVTMNPTDTAETRTNNTGFIPQLDGQIIDTSSISYPTRSPCAIGKTTSQFACENCEENFESEKLLKEHTDKHEWGCDECFLCFTTKYSVDLHELEHHGHEPDSIAYIRDHIPQSTKDLFQAGHRQR